MNVDQREFEALTKVTGINVAMHTGKDLENAMDLIAATLISGLEVKGCSIKILNERHNVLEIISIKGMTDEFVQRCGDHAMISSCINQEALKGEVVYVEDIDNTEKSIPNEVREEGMKSVVSHPIRVDSQIIGVISIYDDKPHYFNENDKIFLDSIATHCANMINFYRTHRRTDTLLNIANIINSSLDIDQVLNEIVIQSAAAMQCKAASLRVLNPTTNRLTFKTSCGLSQDYIKTIPRGLKQSPIDSEVLEKNEVVWIKDASEDPRVASKEAAVAENLGSMLCAPLSYCNRPMGILKVYTAVPTEFTPEETQFLKSIAEMGATAIYNASLFGKIHSLYKLTSALSSTLDVQSLLDLLSMHAARFMQAIGSQVLVWDSEKEKFTSKATYHLDENFACSVQLSKNMWSASETLKGKSIIVSNVEKEDRLDIKYEALKAGINALVSVPLKAGDRVAGIIQVYHKSPRNFTQDEIEFLTTLANHGALAIENAIVHNNLKTNYDKLIDDIYVWHDWTSYLLRE
jgi:GAF domain-containing protein